MTVLVIIQGRGDPPVQLRSLLIVSNMIYHLLSSSKFAQMVTIMTTPEPPRGSEPIDEGPLDYRDPEWVADQLGIDKQTVYKYLQDGTLPGLQLGRKWLISERALARQLDEEQRRQTAARRAAGQPDGSDLLRRLLDDDDARRILGLAKNEAARMFHNYLGQEHFLLAFAQSPDGAASRALSSFGIDAGQLRKAVEGMIGPGEPPAERAPAPTAGLTPRSLRALELAAAEAAAIGESRIGSGLLLVGIIREGTGVGVKILDGLGVDLDEVEREALQQTSESGPGAV